MKNLILFFIQLLICEILTSQNKKVFTDILNITISVDGREVGDLKLGLYGKIVPKTVNNFKTLCLGTLPQTPGFYTKSYKNVRFHKIVPGFIIQGGDYTQGHGGSESIYGAVFEDENFEIKHEFGTLSMANSGPNSNGSQFFIVTFDAPWLDNKHVAFGKVLENINLLKYIESLGTSSGSPVSIVKITNCFEIMK